MKVAELIAELQRFPPDAEVKGTWEGVIAELSVYQSKDGTVLVDADGCSYQKEFEKNGVPHGL